MAIVLYEGIMYHSNVSNVSNNDGKWNLKVYILVSYAWKSRFGIIFASIATPMK